MATATISADSWGWGWNLSAAYAPRPDTLLSLTYRSKVSHKFEGDAHFSKPAGLPALDRNGTRHSRTARPRSIWTCPSRSISASVPAITDHLGVNGAVTYTRWSRLNELRARLGNGSPDVVTPLNWKDSIRYSLGASYSLSDAWRLRAGCVV